MTAGERGAVTVQWLRIRIPGFTPRGMGRPRATVIGGHARVYTPKRSAQAMDEIRAAAIRAVAESAWILVERPEPVHVEIVARFPVPASWSKKRASAAHGAPHTGRPDADNVCKLVLDALTGIAWQDDTQVAYLVARKEWDLTGGLEIAVCATAVQAGSGAA